MGAGGGAGGQHGRGRVLAGRGCEPVHGAWQGLHADAQEGGQQRRHLQVCLQPSVISNCRRSKPPVTRQSRGVSSLQVSNGHVQVCLNLVRSNRRQSHLLSLASLEGVQSTGMQGLAPALQHRWRVEQLLQTKGRQRSGSVAV